MRNDRPQNHVLQLSGPELAALFWKGRALRLDRSAPLPVHTPAL